MTCSPFQSLGVLYLYWLMLHFEVFTCNGLQPTQLKIVTSALAEDTDGSFAQDGAHFRKSVSLDGRGEIDSAHSAITPSDMKGAQDGQHRTHRQAHSENQVSPPLVIARLDTRSLLIGGERAKLLSANRPWHPWDWVYRPASVTQLRGDDASTSRKSFLTRFSNADALKSREMSNSGGNMLRRVSHSLPPIVSGFTKSSGNLNRHDQSLPRWKERTNSFKHRLRNLSGLRERYTGRQGHVNMKDRVIETDIEDKAEISTIANTPITVSSHTVLPSEPTTADSNKTSLSFIKNSKTVEKREVHNRDDPNDIPIIDPNQSIQQSPKDFENEHLYQTHSNPEGLSSNQVRGKIYSEGTNHAKGSLTPHQDKEDSKGDKDAAEHSTQPTRSRRSASRNEEDASVSQQKRAREEGDAIIGALFPLHETPRKAAYSRQCKTIREYYGIQRVEVFIMTIERINRDPDLLPNITLGWDIRDTCWYSPIALENSIDFIKDAIASQQAALSSAARSNPVSTVPSAATSFTSSSPPSSILSSPFTSAPTTNFTQSIQRGGGDATVVGAPTAPDSSCGVSTHLKPIVGLVGPGSSETSIQVQNLLQIFNIPQIGYSATSHDLSDKSHYKYFLRVVPPDIYQAQALADIVSSFNFTYISLVHSDGNYGIRGMEAFKDRASEKGICFGAEDNVASNAEDEDFDTVVDNLLKWPNATAVVCFCEGMTVRNLVRATRRKNKEGAFLIIGSDGWGNRVDVVQGLESAFQGGISLMLYSPRITPFGKHYASLKPYGPSKNPWFKEFWEEKFNCSLEEGSRRGFRRCSGNESLVDSKEDSKLGFVVKAVEAMAHGLHNMHQDLCPLGGKGLCPAMTPINGSLYLRYLLNTRFKSFEENEEVYFDSKGDPPGRYEILNYQPSQLPNHNTSYSYVTIGHWMNGSLTMNSHSIYWPRRSQGFSHQTQSFKSLCSEPCKFGQAKKVRGQTCCWVCSPCLENQILVDNNTECRDCDLGMWPNANKTDCLEIPIDFIDIGDTEAIVCVSLACLGMSATAWIAAIFAKNHNTPIVKASTRELSYILLIGIALAFSSNFFIVSKPSREFCYIVRILPGLSFSLIYGALVTRTNRIARILEGSKRILTKKPKFMSASAQLVITGIIIGVECAVIVGMLLYQPPNSKLDYPSPQEVRLVCDTSTLGIVVPLGFDLVLILLCTIYAVKTRNLPENFNEAKFIGFTMYSTCVIWMGFFPIYFAGEHKEVTLCICVSLSAAIALLLLFVPKVYIIVWVPEKNTRGAFTTSRDVRCHIGSKSMASVDSVDLRESSTLDSLFKSEKGLGKVWRQKSLDERRLRFVMQRTNTGSDSDTPYSNHGVLSASTVALLPQQSRDKSFSEPSSKMPGGQRKSLDSRVTYLDLPRDAREAQKSAVEALRQNLARDFPEHRRCPGLPPLRPGSPAEREKHKVKQSSLEHLVDLDTILRVSKGDDEKAPRKLGKPGEFRKSLSSSCVSTTAKTKSVECQTSDELVQYLLPTLRRRCVGKSKKLERSCAVVDEGLHQVRSADTNTTGGPMQSPSSGGLKAVRVFNYPSSYHQNHALTIQKQPVMFLTLADGTKAGSEAPRSSNARPKKNKDKGKPFIEDPSQISFIPGIGQRCCQQFYHHSNQYRNHRRGRKYHSMVVPPSHMPDHICKLHQKTYRFPKLYGFDELTPSCSSDTSCVDDADTAESAGVSSRRPKSASPGHSVPLYPHGRTLENEHEPFLSPAHLPRDSRSRSAGYIPLHACCSGLHGETCAGVCWVDSLATCSANDGSNVSTVSTTDSSSLIIPQFQSSMDSDVSQISNEEDDDEDDDDDGDSNDNDGDVKDGLPEGLELYVTDPRTNGGLGGDRFPHSIFTTATSGAGMTNRQPVQEDRVDTGRERIGGERDPCDLLVSNVPNQKEYTTSGSNTVDSKDSTVYSMQFNSPIQSMPVGNGPVAGDYQCESPDGSGMKEFQRLLQGHGVELDLSNVQSSDL